MTSSPPNLPAAPTLQPGPTLRPAPTVAPAAAGAAGFSADPASLTTASSRFAEEAAQLSSAQASLVGRLQVDGTCWGDDTQGSAFGAVYQPRADQMVADIADLVAGLWAAATALNQSAQQYQAAEDASTFSTTPTSAGGTSP